MTLHVLTDNNPGKNTQAEHGLSYYNDTGQSDLFVRNALTMFQVTYGAVAVQTGMHFTF
jgi:hypothetical protein